MDHRTVDLMIPALVAEGSVSSDAAFEKSSRLLAILCKLAFLATTETLDSALAARLAPLEEEL